MHIFIPWRKGRRQEVLKDILAAQLTVWPFSIVLWLCTYSFVQRDKQRDVGPPKTPPSQTLTPLAKQLVVDLAIFHPHQKDCHREDALMDVTRTEKLGHTSWQTIWPREQTFFKKDPCVLWAGGGWGLNVARKFEFGGGLVLNHSQVLKAPNMALFYGRLPLELNPAGGAGHTPITQGTPLGL